MIGALVDRALGAFASWAVRSHPAPEQCTSGAKFAGRVIADYISGEPYITRVLFPRVLGVRPMLHHIHRADHERDLHDHPWSWALSIVLRGSYDEQRLVDGDTVVVRRVRWFNLLRGGDYHRITELHGDVWTLFISGPNIKSWGFRVWDRATMTWQHVQHDDYFARRKAERARGD